MAGPQAPGGRGVSFREFLIRHEIALALALLFLITIPLLTKIFTSDFGTHIAIGRQIVQTRSLPDKEFLNYPSLGMNNPNGEWGFEAILYLVHAAGGAYGVSLFLWAVVFSIYLLIHRATVLRGANPLLAVVAIFAFSGFLRIRIQPRPEILTYLFIALTIFLFTEYYYGKRKWVVYLFVPLILVWANVHPTYLMGFFLCGAFFVDRLARAAWSREFQWGRLKSWVIPPVAVGIAGLIVCGLNPHGYNAILTPLHLLSRGESGGGGSILMSISELTPVKGTGMFVYYKAAAAFAGISLIMGAVGRRIYLLDIFLFAIAFKGGWDSARAVSMMGLFISPGASLHLTGFLAKAGDWFASKAARKQKEAGKGAVKKKGKAKEGGKEARKDVTIAPHPVPRRESRGRLAATAITVAGLLVFGSYTMAFSISQLQFGVGMTEHKFSFAAADFLRKNPIPGNMFNFFDIGGFLDWQMYPQALTFIDGRTYNQQVFMEHQTVTGAYPGWEQVIRKYRINYMVLKSMDSSGMILPIVRVLASDPNWSLVFADGLFMVFVRNAPENEAYIRAHEIPKGKIPQHIIWEAYHYIYLGVSPVIAYQTMSNMYQIMGNIPAAAAALRQALEDYDDPYLRAQLNRLEDAAKGYPSSGTPGGHPPAGSSR